MIAADGAASGARWPGRAPAILALHGFTGVGADFDALATRIDNAVIAPDLPGHGGRPVGDSAPGLESVAERLADLLPQAPIVMGYSMGGRLALTLAARHGNRLDGLILIGARPGLASGAERQARAARDAELACRIEAIGVERFLDEWARVPIIATQSRIAPAIRAQMARHRRHHDAAGLAGSLRTIGTGLMAPLWHRLPQIDTPTLLITGAEDHTFADIARRMAAAMPNARHVEIEGAGHCAHLERPDATADAIGVWLDGIG